MNYIIAPTDLTQARFQGRLTAEPLINLSEYEIKAVFDWLELHLQTKEVHQALNIHRWLTTQNAELSAFKSCFVFGPSRDGSYIGSEFVIRFQEPQPTGLRSLLRAVLDNYRSEGTEFDKLPLVGLELSLDIYSAPEFAESPENYAFRRMLMTQLLHKHILVHNAHREEMCRPRFTYNIAGETHTPKVFEEPRKRRRVKLARDAATLGIAVEDLSILYPSMHLQPFVDATFYYGEANRRLFFRCMDKTTDQRTPLGAKLLPFEQTRSRIELTFIDEIPGDGLGPTSVNIGCLGDITPRGLNRFNQLLQFGLPTFTPSTENPSEPNRIEWEIFSKSGVAGLSYFQDVQLKVEAAKSGRKLRDRKELMSTGQCRRYPDLNRRVTKALNRLHATWERGWGRYC